MRAIKFGFVSCDNFWDLNVHFKINETTKKKVTFVTNGLFKRNKNCFGRFFMKYNPILC